MKHIKRTTSISLAIVLIVSSAYLVFEPAVSMAVEDIVVVSQAVTGEIEISSPDDITLLPSIPGMTGNFGNPSSGTVTWTVKTVNATGFNMKIKASQTDALYLASDPTYYFTDYTPEGPPVPDYSWSSPASAAAEFGFTVQPATPADTVQNFLDNGTTTCNTGSTQTAEKCWLGFNGTTDINIINRATATSGAGEAEVVKFQAESNAKYLKEGSYAGTVTVTATINE